MKIRTMLFTVIVAMTAPLASAQPQTSVDVSKSPGKANVAATATVTATVQAIDPATRIVTLKDKNGKLIEVEVGEEARTFDQLKVGDIVTTENWQALRLVLA